MEDWFEHKINKAFGDFDREFDHLSLIEDSQQFKPNMDSDKVTMHQESNVNNSSTKSERGLYYHSNEKLRDQDKRKSINTSPEKENTKQDGCPAHYARSVREYLDEEFPGRWIGRSGPISWPGRSPDLNPLYFFYWGAVKEKVYSKAIESEFEPRQRIAEAAELVNNGRFARKTARSLLKRCRESTPYDISPLKELLKRSYGSSLSELLQKKNLSLADLLSGKKSAIQALQTETLPHLDENIKTIEKDDSRTNSVIIEKENEKIEEKTKNFLIDNESRGTEPQQKFHTRNASSSIDHSSKQGSKMMYDNTNNGEKYQSINLPITTVSSDYIKSENIFNMTGRRRLLPGIRKRPKLRIPMRNNTTTKHYMKQIQSTPAIQIKSTSTMTPIKDTENTIETDVKYSEEKISTTNKRNSDNDDEPTTIETTTLETTLDYTSTQSNFGIPSQIPVTTTKTGKKTNIAPIEIGSTTEMAEHNNMSKIPRTETRPRLIITNSELRKQILNNRLKRKKLIQKDSSDDHEDETMKSKNIGNRFGSASELITRTEKPHIQITTKIKSYIEATETSEDLTTTHETNTQADENLITEYTTINSEINTSESPILLTTEDTAKKEIEEILEDLNTRKRLSKILAERNMTFKELVAHRERGSSRVHLADIFHNTSHELSPLKSFLSKSSIEPISKEIYPLRVLLEANLHDTPIQTDTLKTYHDQLPNIPIVMNFGNNVNENGEKSGMVPTMNKFHNHSPIDKHGLKQDSEGGTYFTSVMSVNVTHDAREGRKLNENSALDNLKKIISTMQKDFMNKTRNFKETHKNAPLEQDRDGDGLIILEDLQHLDEFGKEVIQPNKNFEVNRHGKNSELDLHHYNPDSNYRFPEKNSSKAKSVTVVTSAVVALLMILFLLTYIGCKWQQKRNLLKEKDNFNLGKINMPVFENRKSAKNSSTRSISPMLSTSNIYNMNTIGTINGKESPEYMWDSLRKPFQ
ncbi:hypothetical protein EVAR_46186_1 [Eumeta japonica]|uniref:Uncharacterized protein n=1 Tax=Eumeta variegata TaxID=151549 RepID=A0A4C1WCQ1_EUMVA|nr:hypothetical protein EVAR_46186_1 [Eumeta japonica]